MGHFQIELSLEQTERNEKIVTKFSPLDFSWSSGNTKFRTEPFRLHFLVHLHKVIPHEYFHLYFIFDLHKKQNLYQRLCLVGNIRVNILIDTLNGYPFVIKYKYTSVSY